MRCTESFQTTLLSSSIKTCGCLSEKELVRVYEGLVRSVCEHACMPGMVNSPAKTSNWQYRIHPKEGMEIIIPSRPNEDAIKDLHLDSLEKKTTKICHSSRSWKIPRRYYTALWQHPLIIHIFIRVQSTKSQD